MKTNTECMVVNTLENTLKKSENGCILPLQDEALVEKRINHDFKSWDDIGLFIDNNLKMKLHGRQSFQIFKFHIFKVRIFKIQLV